jgi:murein DD-endopeptidase MepM/ murein hydrolase activator NlpD
MTFTTMWITVIAAALLAAAPAHGGPGTAGGPAGRNGPVDAPGPVGRNGPVGPGLGRAGPAGAASGASGLPAGGTASNGSGPAGGGCAGAPGAAARCWPVTGPGPHGRPAVLRLFNPPAAPWAAGHRGVDLGAGPSVPVRAAASGEIAFAGEVAGTPVVVLRLPDGLRTTYEPVRATVPVGAQVPAGHRVGVLAGALPHCPGACLHWGLLRGDVYLDPLSLLPPSLRRPLHSRLLPVYGQGAPQGPRHPRVPAVSRWPLTPSSVGSDSDSRIARRTSSRFPGRRAGPGARPSARRLPPRRTDRTASTRRRRIHRGLRWAGGVGGREERARPTCSRPSAACASVLERCSGVK